MLIREKRKQYGWSQAQLAELSGLSLRTIQRIEKGNKPNVESLKALAAVFETDVATLSFSDEIDVNKLTDEEKSVLKHVKARKNFFLNLLAFTLIIPLILLSNWIFAPQERWGALSALGWGTWLVIEALYVFDAKSLFDKGWDKRQMEKRLGRKSDEDND